MRCLTWIICALALIRLGDVTDLASAPPVPSSLRDSSKVPTTEIEFELLSGSNVGSGLSAQEWGREFQKLGVSLRIRMPVLDDHPEVREQKFGTIRRVTVIGQLEASGRIVFPGRSFRLSETPRLAEWIRELRTYGAQGSPSGKPAFGLSPNQFQEVYSALSAPVAAEVRGQAFREAIASFGLPEEYPLRLSAAAEDWLRTHGNNRGSLQSLQGFSVGTALAIVLNEFGLGFRPLRTPSGTIELDVEPLETLADSWPVGWKLPDDASRLELAPKLFKLHPMELNNVPLADVMKAASAATDVPVLIDRYRIAAQGLDIDSVRVSFPPRQASWSSVLGGVTNPKKLARRLLLDEAGRPFLWITTLQSVLQQRNLQRAASHVKP